MIRSYELSLRLHVVPDLGAIKLSKLRRRDVQALADRLLAAGQDPSTVRNSIKPLRVIYRRAIRAGDVAVNPRMNLDLPAVRGRRDRIVSREQAADLIAALRHDDHALWGTAFYAGLRLGELRALLWSDVDLAGGVIRVERAVDQKGATIRPKSVAGVRTVPIPKALRSLLAAHRLQRVGEGYVFGSSLTTPFTPSAVLRRARLRWSKIDSLKPLADFGLHESAAHIRLSHDRRRGKREGAHRVHGAQLDNGHVRPLRSPHARQSPAGCGAARRIPRHAVRADTGADTLCKRFN